MYIPASFLEADPAKLHDFIDGHGFATLISSASDEPIASHLPILLDRDAGPHGRLIGHFARANTHWEVASRGKSLVIFHGPHAYVSPGWMEARNVVPTWNYVVVHAYGTVRLFDDRDRLRDIVRRTVEKYESPRAEPWSMNGPEPEFLDKLLAAIVGFEIDIERLEGKWKLNQNHPAERRERIIRGLQATGRPDEWQIAELMQAKLES
jgi:transcriptional regulator